ncbi:MAG: hypothetical protein H8E42_12650 [Nitrospinae bacterium]|nr:hypothetical protein [Nitrospinota bacterium]MBL7021462.1 hypothetical protein [Nitrospinaceae bacterium]
MNTTLEIDKKIATDDYFMLAIRNWDNKLEDYLPVGDPSTVTQSFSEYPNAEIAYFSTDYGSCSQAGGKDVKVELLHMRFGISHMVRNRILFP